MYFLGSWGTLEVIPVDKLLFAICYKIHQNNFTQKEVTEIKKVNATMLIFYYYIRYRAGSCFGGQVLFGMFYKIHENNFSQKEVNAKGSKYEVHIFHLQIAQGWGRSVDKYSLVM